MQPLRKLIIGGALVGTTLTGGAIGAMLVNGSATADTASTAATTAADPAAGTPAAAAAGAPTFDPTKGGHVGANGIKEELLTGDTAEKVKAAALAAVPGGTIQRVETDAEGSPYEAHMTKADGSEVTVKVGSDFKVTGIETGGPGGPGHGRGGPPPAATPSA